MSETIVYRLPTEEEYATSIKVLNAPTLRDHFAMAALTGIISGAAWNEAEWDVIRDCWQIADAMLEARDKKECE